MLPHRLSRDDRAVPQRKSGAEPPSKPGAESHERRGHPDGRVRFRTELPFHRPRAASCGGRRRDGSSCYSEARLLRDGTNGSSRSALRQPRTQRHEERESSEKGRDQNHNCHRPVRRLCGNCRSCRPLGRVRRSARRLSTLPLQDRAGGGMECSPLLVRHASRLQPDGEVAAAREHAARPHDTRGWCDLRRGALRELRCSCCEAEREPGREQRNQKDPHGSRSWTLDAASSRGFPSARATGPKPWQAREMAYAEPPFDRVMKR